MKKIIKAVKTKVALSACAVGVSVGAFAAEGDNTLAADIVQSAQDTLTGMMTSVGPAIIAIIGAGLAIWGGIALVGVIKKAFSAGKGR